ncbi:hypothetical protein GOHSU_41_00360 [Gordonia hirsuta DSM 44140 = NBRC 16056]|uniref:Uncharacterized protein n=1 Tax=Gordonia hirsuta DSM 44140 = NBRC 16056 TaxID=1121927 RepID=L7LEP0_9ACTN|nr:DUF6308 family protein [Gordonia hirsuta]GAC58498.1 hypothetical protein GOHSU_41_00360 [Gordonia hirsuta DSM 44140 = NBRC 16056]
MAIEGMRLPPILDPGQGELAVEVLTAYFYADPLPVYSGSRFERFAGGGDRPETRDEFGADDLVAVTLLDVSFPGDAALRILGDTDPDYRDQLSALLRRLPTWLDLVDADEDVLADAEELWSLVRGNRGVGRAKTSKLLARKRPRLLPIMDSVVVKTVGHNPRQHLFYQNLQAALRADNCRLVSHLDEIRKEAGIESDISTIRVFDILVWMWGSGRVDRLAVRG